MNCKLIGKELLGEKTQYGSKSLECAELLVAVDSSTSRLCSHVVKDGAIKKSGIACGATSQCGGWQPRNLVVMWCHCVTSGLLSLQATSGRELLDTLLEVDTCWLQWALQALLPGWCDRDRSNAGTPFNICLVLGVDCPSHLPSIATMSGSWRHPAPEIYFRRTSFQCLTQTSYLAVRWYTSANAPFHPHPQFIDMISLGSHFQLFKYFICMQDAYSSSWWLPEFGDVPAMAVRFHWSPVGYCGSVDKSHVNHSWMIH